MSYTERELLARLVACEAGGEGENGMKAVATTIINRRIFRTGVCRISQGGNLRI